MPKGCSIVVELHVVGGQRHKALKNNVLNVAHDLTVRLHQRLEKPNVCHSSNVASPNSSDEGLNSLLADASAKLGVVLEDGN
jgi:hypothetical protein